MAQNESKPIPDSRPFFDAGMSFVVCVVIGGLAGTPSAIWRRRGRGAVDAYASFFAL